MNLTMTAARNNLEKSSYSGRTKNGEYLNRLAEHFGREVFSAQQAAEALKMTRKTCLGMLRDLPKPLIEMKAHMFRLDLPSVEKGQPMHDGTLHGRLRVVCAVKKQPITDQFKKAGIVVARGVEWLAKRQELSPPESAALERVVNSLECKP